jgi:dipeptidyl aminopeptidase/acylaminoacyl peptidase
VTSAAFSPDGERVITGSHDKSARIWDVRTGRALTEQLKHTGRLEAVHFSPDGERVLTASEDGTLRIWDAHTGLSLSDPLNHERWVFGAQFSPDGQRVVTASDRKEALVWEVPSAPVPVPEWLPELAEAVGGRRLNDQGSLEHGSNLNLPALQQRLVGDSRADYYARWGKWFFSDRATRTISPYSAVTVPEYIQRRIQANTLDSLREAVRLSPTNALALARLARQIFAGDEAQNPRKNAEADFLSRRAVERAPDEPEVLKLRAEVAERIGKLRNP